MLRVLRKHMRTFTIIVLLQALCVYALKGPVYDL